MKHVVGYTCAEDKAMCADGNGCVLLRFLCDEYPDCSDGSDEDPEMCRKYPLHSGFRSRF